MRVVGKDHGIEILSFAPGEEVLTALTTYCTMAGIHAGSFVGLGAVKEAELSWYDVDAKAYRTEHLQEKLELASLTGTISIYEEKMMVHAHGVFSDQQMHAIAGHVNSMVVSGACEVTLWRLKDTIMRTYSKDVGLALMGGGEEPFAQEKYGGSEGRIIGSAPSTPSGR